MLGKITGALCAVALLAGFMAPVASAQEGMPPMGPPEEMKVLAKYDGTWTVDFSVKMTPDSDWVTSAATCEFKMVLDGAAQQMSYDGTMMGMPFDGIGLTAFNRTSQKWQNSWVDNMMGMISLYEGEMKGNALVVSGMDKMGDHEVLTRMTSTFVSDDQIDWLMENSSDMGKTFVEGAKATYKRQK